MKEDLHELIDGSLPDEQAAELLHLLSVDPAKRSLFRQHIVLQRDLCRNEQHAPLTALEESEMLERLNRSIGLGATSPTARPVRRGVMLLAIGFILGSSVGYLGHGLVGKDSMTTAAAPDTVEVVRMVPTPGPSFNRDSVVAAIRDSLASAASRPAERPTVTPRVGRRSSSVDDPTGAADARRLMREKGRRGSR